MTINKKAAMKTLTTSELAGMAAAIDALDRELRDELHAELVQSGDQRFVSLAGSVHDLGTNRPPTN